MSSDVLERNLANLLKHGALRPDPARIARARDRFRRSVRQAGEPVSRRLAAAAAAFLTGITILCSAGSGSRTSAPSMPPATTPLPVPTLLFPLGKESGLLQGTLKIIRQEAPGRVLQFEAHSPLPEGLQFRVRLIRIGEQRVGDQLAPSPASSSSTTCTLEQGTLLARWPDAGPATVRFEVSAPDAIQERSVVQSLRWSESERSWSFDFLAWDENLLAHLGPRLAEIADLAREALNLLAEVDAARSSEATFLDGQKSLIARAEACQRRAEAIVSAGLYPAAASQIAFAARDLAAALPIFKWEGGKYAGPKSYYTDDKAPLTFRREPFSVAALRKYFEEAPLIAGREFDLWILKDIRRGGPRTEHRTALQEQERRPGVSEFVDRLLESPDGLDLLVRQLPR